MIDPLGIEPAMPCVPISGLIRMDDGGAVGGGADVIDGGGGYDTISYSLSNSVDIDLSRASATWSGDAQGDSFISIEAFALSGFDDFFSGSEGGNDSRNGGLGDDTLYGGNGNDTIAGGDGRDTLFGGAGADTFIGGNGLETVSYLSSAVVAVSIDLTKASSTWTGDAQGDSFKSIDRIELSNLGDSLRGNSAADTIYGETGDDQILGAGGDDKLFGGDGDQLFGDGGNDKLVGGVGNDILTGGLGGETLIGNEGADVFKNASAEESQRVTIDGVTQRDQILDFTRGQDKIDLSLIDANSALAGDQTFSFLADPASHSGDWSGFVWATTDNRGITTIYASNDADADAEMQIYMSHGYTFTGGDFIL